MKNRVHKKAKPRTKKYVPPSPPVGGPPQIVPRPIYLHGFFITNEDMNALHENLRKAQVRFHEAENAINAALAAPIRQTTVKVVDKGISSADSYDAMNFVGKGLDE